MDNNEVEELQDWEMLETPSTRTIQMEPLIQSDYFSIHKDQSADPVTVVEEEEQTHELGSEEGDHGEVFDEVRGFGEVGSEVCSETSEVQVVEDARVDSQEMETLAGGSITGEIEQMQDDCGVQERSGDVIQGGGGGSGGDEGKSVTVWWKVPVELLKFCVFRVSPVWTFSIAAAVMGLILLKRRLSRMRRKSRSIPIKLTVEDKKVSQMRAARLNEAFSVVRHVPIVRPLLPSSGVTPWPLLNLR